MTRDLLVRPGSAPREPPAAAAAGLRLWLRGFAYLPGHAAGAASLRRLAKEARREGLATASARLRGHHLLVTEDEATGALQAVVDPSGLFHACWSADGLATSLPALARLGGLGPGDLDPEAVADALVLGSAPFGVTPLRAIRRLGPRDVLTAGPGGVAVAPERPLPRLADPGPAPALLEVLEGLVTAAAGLRVELDLSGGIDSRLLVGALAHLGLPFTAATLGGAGRADVPLARAVAAAAACEHVVVDPAPERFAEDLPALLRGTGYLADPVAAHGDWRLTADRRARGVELAVSGVGGELLKDFWWLQDMPRYRRARADLERLCDRRILPPPTSTAHLAPEVAAAARAVRARLLARLEALRCATNTETYDAIYFGVRTREVAGRSLTTRAALVPAHAPLLDRDVARLGFALPRRDRAFNRFHRRVLGEVAPALARLPTTEGGMTVAPGARAAARDAGRWGADKARRATRKLVPRGGAPPGGRPPPGVVRALAGDAVARLAEAGVLRPDATPADVPDSQLGPVLALGGLLAALDGR